MLEPRPSPPGSSQEATARSASCLYPVVGAMPLDDALLEIISLLIPTRDRALEYFPCKIGLSSARKEAAH